jgi:quercetin dioxygenase-like cupin family protein
VLNYTAWDKIEQESMNPLLRRQFITGKNITLARFQLKKGANVPQHHHVNEQVTYILEGAVKFAIDGREIVVRAGEVLCIPPDMPHEVWALEDSLALDVFSPPRADWVNKTDAYLRGASQR